MASTAASCDSKTWAGPRNVQIVLGDAGGLHHAAVRGEVAVEDGQAAVGRVGVRRRRGCSRRRRRCPAWPSGSRCENGSVVRTPPGAAWNSSSAASAAAPPRMSQSASHAVQRRRCTVVDVAVQQAGRGRARRGWPGCRRRGARPPCGTSACSARPCTGTAPGARCASMSATSKSSSASWAAASRCSTVLVEPPMAMSSVIAFSNAAAGGDRARAAPRRRRRRSSGGPGRRSAAPARSKSALRAAWVASVEPLPGSARPSASVRQFIELAVNMPEHEPQVGQAECSISPSCVVGDRVVGRRRSSRRSGRAWRARRPRWRPSCRPPSGRRRRRRSGCSGAARPSACPGVILSQLEMQTSASAQCALHHVLDRVGDQLAAGQRVEHAAVAHGDAVVDGDRVELAPDAAGRGDRRRRRARRRCAGGRGRARTG